MISSLVHEESVVQGSKALGLLSRPQSLAQELSILPLLSVQEILHMCQNACPKGQEPLPHLTAVPVSLFCSVVSQHVKGCK